MAKSFRVIGTRPIRHDGVDKVTGRAKYGADYAFPGMLHGKILRSPHAHAMIKSINTDEALKLPGVKAIITSADLPEIPDKIDASGEIPTNLNHVSSQYSGARQGPVRRPCGRRRRRDQRAYRRRGVCA